MTVIDRPTEWPTAERLGFTSQTAADVASAILALNTPHTTSFTIAEIGEQAAVKYPVEIVNRMWKAGWMLKAGKRNGSWLFWLTPDGVRMADLALFDWHFDHFWQAPGTAR